MDYTLHRLRCAVPPAPPARAILPPNRRGRLPPLWGLFLQWSLVKPSLALNPLVTLVEPI